MNIGGSVDWYFGISIVAGVNIDVGDKIGSGVGGVRWDVRRGVGADDGRCVGCGFVSCADIDRDVGDRFGIGDSEEIYLEVVFEVYLMAI